MLDQPSGLMFDILTPGEGRSLALDIRGAAPVMRDNKNESAFREERNVHG